MIDLLTMNLSLMADSSAAISTIKSYVVPTMVTLASIAGIVSVLFIVYGGILYMTSTGHPEKLEQAKKVLKNALLGLVLVLGAGALAAILNGALTQPSTPSSAVLPSLETIEPSTQSSGLIDILINAIVGLLNTIIQVVATPFLGALDFFTKETPLMSGNSTVFNFWLAMVGIADTLFVIVIALVGFHVMSASALGLDEVDFKHLLPRIIIVFLLLNTSIFIIDGIIAASNALIDAVNNVGGASGVWETLTNVFTSVEVQSVAALLVMLVFIIFSFILLVYYVGRLVTLFIGAVLSPLVILVWLIPGFKDFSETAMKTYLTTVFVLFIHVVILTLAGSLFVGLSSDDAPNVLMSMAVGLATVIALLKTQGVLMQFSYVSLGAQSSRQLGTQFIHGIAYLGARSKAAASWALSSDNGSTFIPRQPSSSAVSVASVKVTKTTPTGTTTKAPRVNYNNTEAISYSKSKRVSKGKDGSK